ncbi:MAG: ATP-binding protein, partial [Nitrospirota bacterium]|nr:ATP-binding protein [Nitrospirota bacterium]
NKIDLSSDLAKELEETHLIEKTKKSLQAIFDGIEDGISVINKEYEIIRANKAILNIFGKGDFSEILGRKCFNEYYQRNTICDNCPAERTFKEGTPSQRIKISREIGKRKTILNESTFPIKGEDNNVIQVIEYIKDITDVVELEDQLLYSERLAGVGKLAAGIAHEIRNPLSNIKAAAQLCLKKYELDEKIRKHLKIILKSSEKVNKVTRDLLNLAKPRDVSFTIGSADKVINSTCDLVNARCLKQHIRLTKRLQRGLPQIFLDEKLLEETFLNFMLNALDAMPKGGRLAITAYYDHDAEEILISFVDSGYGISEDNFSRIFDPFFTTKKDGTGLGLSLALQIIELHTGKIHIESKPDYGTEVMV